MNAMLESCTEAPLSESRRDYPDREVMDPSNSPLTGFELFRTRDADEARRAFGQLLAPHAMRPARRGARLDVRCHAVSLGDASLIYAQYGAAVRLEPGALGSFYLVGMPVSGVSTIRCGRSEVVSRRGVASVQSCSQPVVADWDDDCRKLSVKISRAALERRLAAMIGRAPTQPIEFDPVLALDGETGKSWSRLVEFVSAELSPVSIYLKSPLARRLLDDALISTLLMVQPHNYSLALEVDAGAAAPGFVRRAEEMIAADPALPDGLAGLAVQLGVSLRRLQAGFRRYRNSTPIEFVRVQRLAKAREALAGAQPGTRVTDVALGVGYFHLGRFAAEYKARYGESPSDTLARSRRPPA